MDVCVFLCCHVREEALKWSDPTTCVSNDLEDQEYRKVSGIKWTIVESKNMEDSNNYFS